MVAEFVPGQRQRRRFTEAEDALIIERYPTATLREIADELGRHWTSVQKRVAVLVRDGRLDPSLRRVHRPWTREEELEALELVERGAPVRAIARRLRRSENAVKVWLTRHAGVRHRRPMSASDVAELLGIRCPKAVARWCREGWLRCSRGLHAGRRRQYLVQHDDLVRFLEDPRHWHRWDPGRIRDSALREWATEIRAERYLTTAEVATRLHVQDRTVNSWIRRGLLPAVRHGNWRVRERDLEGFVPPYERSKRGLRLRRFAPEEDLRLLALRRAGLGWTEIAARLGRPVESVYGRYRRLMEQGRGDGQGARAS